MAELSVVERIKRLQGGGASERVEDLQTGFETPDMLEMPSGVLDTVGRGFQEREEEGRLITEGVRGSIQGDMPPGVADILGPAGGEAAFGAAVSLIPIGGQMSMGVRIGLLAARVLARGAGAGTGAILSDLATARDIDAGKAGIETVLSTIPPVLFDFAVPLIRTYKAGRPLSSGKAMNLVNDTIQQSFGAPGVGRYATAGRIFDELDQVGDKIKVVPKNIMDEFGSLLRSEDNLNTITKAIEEIDLEFNLPINPKTGMRPFQQLFDSMVKGRFTADMSIGHLRRSERMLTFIAARADEGSPKRKGLDALRRAINQSLDDALQSGQMGLSGEKLRKARTLHNREVAAEEMMSLVNSDRIMQPITRGKNVGVTLNFGQLVKDIDTEIDLVRKGIKKPANANARAVVERMMKVTDEQGRKVGLAGFNRLREVVQDLRDPSRVRVDNVTALFAVAAFTGNATAIGVGLASGIGSALVSDSGLRIITDAIRGKGSLNLKTLGFAINAARREVYGVGEEPDVEIPPIDLNAVKDFFGGSR